MCNYDRNILVQIGFYNYVTKILADRLETKIFSSISFSDTSDALQYMYIQNCIA